MEVMAMDPAEAKQVVIDGRGRRWRFDGEPGVGARWLVSAVTYNSGRRPQANARPGGAFPVQ